LLVAGYSSVIYKPIKIKDLAERLIRKSGYSVKHTDNPNGDIEIITIGLRPGEKLREELLIDVDTQPSPHPKIMRAQEKQSLLDVKVLITDIEQACDNYDKNSVRKLLKSYMSQDYNKQQVDLAINYSINR